MPQRKKDNSKNFLLLVILILFSFAFYQYLSHPTPKIKKIFQKLPGTEETIEEKVNRNLYLTDRSVELDQAKAHMQNQFAAPHVGQKMMTQKSVDNSGLKNGSSEEAVYRDLHRDKKDYEFSPNSNVQAQLYEKQEYDLHRQAQLEALAKAYIENARKHGYEVKVNDDFVVISVRPISGFQARPEGTP